MKLSIMFIFSFLFIYQSQAAPQLLLRTSPNDNGYNIIPGTYIANQTAQINDQGDVAILLDKTHLWTWTNNNYQITYSLEGPRFFRLYQFNNEGEALVEVLNEDFFSEGLFTINSGHLEQVVSTELDFLNIQFFGNSYKLASGEIIFLAKDGGQKQFLLKKSQDGLKNLVKQSTKDKISYLFSPAINNKGQAAIQLRLGEDAFDQNSEDQIRLYSPDGTYKLIATNTGKIKQFLSTPSLNDKGQLIFIGKEEGPTNYLYLWDGIKLNKLIAAGTFPLSDFDSFAPQINNQNQMVFRGFDNKQRPAIFQWQNNQLNILIQEGQNISTDLGPGQFGQHDPSYPLFSGNVSLNNKGEVTFAAGLHPLNNNQIEWGTGLFKTSVNNN